VSTSYFLSDGGSYVGVGQRDTDFDSSVLKFWERSVWAGLRLFVLSECPLFGMSPSSVVLSLSLFTSTFNPTTNYYSSVPFDP